MPWCTVHVVHCSCPMNSAPGTGQKKEEAENAKDTRHKEYPNAYIELK